MLGHERRKRGKINKDKSSASSGYSISGTYVTENVKNVPRNNSMSLLGGLTQRFGFLNLRSGLIRCFWARYNLSTQASPHEQYDKKIKSCTLLQFILLHCKWKHPLTRTLWVRTINTVNNCQRLVRIKHVVVIFMMWPRFDCVLLFSSI